MNKLFKVYDLIIESIIVVFFTIMVILLFAEVISRYIFNFPIMWSEEIGRYLFIWIVYLGSSIAFIKKRHLKVDFLVRKINEPYSIYLEVILLSIIMIFLFFVFLYGLKYIGIYWNTPAYSIKYIKLGWVYASVPIGSIFMVLNLIRIILPILNKIRKGMKLI